MQKRILGTQGLKISAIGLGCMGMSEFYGPGDEAESIDTINRAIELGIDFFDTSDIYGPFTNEVLVGRVLRPHRERSSSPLNLASCATLTARGAASADIPNMSVRPAMPV